jgi:RNA polymerase-binding transcription factor DksA
MADNADIANDNLEIAIKARLSSQEKFDKPSLEECIDCEEDIPLKRQELGGVTRCIDCQTNFENRR